jgi:hypothetical protein
MTPCLRRHREQRYTRVVIGLLLTACAEFVGGMSLRAAEPAILIPSDNAVLLPASHEVAVPLVEAANTLPAADPGVCDPVWSGSSFDGYYSAPYYSTPYYQEPRKRLLPIWGDEARKRGYEIPLPFGGSVVGVWTKESYVVTEIALGPGGVPPVPVDFLTMTDVVGQAQNTSARFDMWLFPFMNLYGLVGYTSGTSGGNLTIDPSSPFLPTITTPVKIDLEGPTYGVGTTFVYGNQWLMALLDLAYTKTDLDFSETDLTATVVTPRVGLHRKFGEMRGAAWIGAMYREVDGRLLGTVDIPLLGGPIQVEVAQEAVNPWNFLLGGQWQFTEHFQVITEYGIGDGYLVVFSAMARF